MFTVTLFTTAATSTQTMVYGTRKRGTPSVRPYEAKWTWKMVSLRFSFAIVMVNHYKNEKIHIYIYIYIYIYILLSVQIFRTACNINVIKI